MRASIVGLACWLTMLGCDGASREREDGQGDAASPRHDAASPDAGVDDAIDIDGKVPPLWDSASSDGQSAAVDGPDGLEASCGSAGGTLRIPDDLALLVNCTQVLGSLAIRDTTLTSLAGPDQLRSIAGSLVIAANARLVEVRGFARLQSIGGDLEVQSNPKLTTVAAFESLDPVGGTISLAENDALDSPALHASAAKLRIEHNLLLSNLRELNVNAQEALVIVGNPSLSEADAHLYANDRYTEEETIMGNRSSRETAMRACGAPDEQTRASYQALAGCTHLLGSLGLQDTSMTDLKALGNLRSIAQDVVMFRPHRILDLSGLENLESVGGQLTISHGEQLQSLAGAERLRAVGGLTIESNHELASVAGLTALETVTGTLSIVGNAMLPQAMAQQFADGLTVGGQKRVSENGP